MISARSCLLCLLIGLELSGWSCLGDNYAKVIPPNDPSIRYTDSAVDDAVTRLVGRPGNSGWGLSVLLKRLAISEDSQILVFSKTSFEAAAVSPRSPRAIYFNDEVAVAYTPAAQSIEIAAMDPRQGVVFYQGTNAPDSRPRRSEVCLQCHQGPATIGVPGMFVGSVFPNAEGVPSKSGAIITDHRTPFADRWGGWYVSATHGEQVDRANAFATDPDAPEVLDGDARQNLRSLIRFFDPSKFPVPTSDIVALLTFEHQTHAANLITRLNWEARIGVHSSALAAREEELARYLMFLDEVALQAPIEGVSTFRSTFERRGTNQQSGHNLREFDLKTRLFRFPLSYMIYSRAFAALPADIRRSLFQLIKSRLITDGSIRVGSLDRAETLQILARAAASLPKT